MKTLHNRAGFSLVELMMSLGILVVGLSMVATAFPTAMMANKLSVADTSATMISENAAAICRAKLSHNTINGLGGALSDQTLQINDAAHTGDLTYPVAPDTTPSTHPEDWVDIGGTDYPSTRYGWLLAARQIGSVNDYQLVFIPYRKFLPGDAAPEFSDVVTDGENITGAGNVVSIGAPVICEADGTYAFVVDSTGKLSGRITPGDALTVGPDGQNSPAIGCYVVRTAVAP
jgi:prepilin-type N-terminal cleavage/methylation domain-containing protein